MFWQMDTTTWHISDEQQLKNHLQNDHRAGDTDQKIWFADQEIQCTGNDTEHGVNEDAKCRNTKENVIQIALVFTAEFQRLNPIWRKEFD